MSAGNEHEAAPSANDGSGLQMLSVKAGADACWTITGLTAIGMLPNNSAITMICAISGAFWRRFKIVFAPVRGPRP